MNEHDYLWVKVSHTGQCHTQWGTQYRMILTDALISAMGEEGTDWGDHVPHRFVGLTLRTVQRTDDDRGWIVERGRLR
jgi:hypothetical protein